jgi:hypothetical protein
MRPGRVMDNYAEQVTENYADQAIARMRSPQEMVIICVDVTNKCDLHCSNCTRLLKNQIEFWDMSPENFRMALRSLRGYPGVIAMIGGNPCMSKHFPELCAIFVEQIPNRKQRGLWSNNIFDYQQVVAETFGVFNLNPHNDKRGISSFERLKQIIPQITYFKGHSHHAPLLTAMQDLYPDPEEMWRLIQGCDINRQWSASIVQNRGELRAYFCEVAASFDLARGEDHGISVTEGWWLRTMPEFSDQVKHFCPGCGVPARLKGHLDIEGVDTYTPFNGAIARNSLKRRRVIEEIHSASDVDPLSKSLVNYNEFFSTMDHGAVRREGVVAVVAYSEQRQYLCLPQSLARDAASAVERVIRESALPAYVANLIQPSDTVLYLGPGLSLAPLDIARKAGRVLALDPGNDAVEMLTLNAKLKECRTLTAERLAAYDQNATAEFSISNDPFDGLQSLQAAGDSPVSVEKVRAHCVRLDDFYDETRFEALVMTIGDHGDCFALTGARNRLADVRIMFMRFKAQFYAEHPDRLQELSGLLERSFNHCYAPQVQVQSTTGFAPVFAHLVAQRANDFLILSKSSLI